MSGLCNTYCMGVLGSGDYIPDSCPSSWRVSWCKGGHGARLTRSPAWFTLVSSRELHVPGRWGDYRAEKRGHRREAVITGDGDYAAFVEAMVDARARLPVDVQGYCWMPNHFHLVLRPKADGDLGRWVL